MRSSPPDATLPTNSHSPADSLGQVTPPGARLRRFNPGLLWIVVLALLAVIGVAISLLGAPPAP